MTTKVVVMGASGFGRECLDVLEAMIAEGDDIAIVGVVDDAPSPVNLDRLASRGVPYLGTRSAWLSSHPENPRYVLGIGDPEIRHRVSGELDAAGLAPFSAIHPSATFGAACSIGKGAVVCAGVAVSNNVKLGEHAHLNPNSTVGHDSLLEDFVSVNPGAVVSGEVTVRRGTLVGASATILQNLEVGYGVTVGAGSVVTKNVPDGVTVVGVPGRW